MGRFALIVGAVTAFHGGVGGHGDQLGPSLGQLAQLLIVRVAQQPGRPSGFPSRVSTAYQRLDPSPFQSVFAGVFGDEPFANGHGGTPSPCLIEGQSPIPEQVVVPWKACIEGLQSIRSSVGV